MPMLVTEIHMMKRLIFLAMLLGLLAGCTAPAAAALPPASGPQASQVPEASNPPSMEPEPTPEPTAAELLLSRMTLREKVGQLFIVRPEALDPSAHVTRISDTLRRSLQTYPVGGFTLFGQNVVNPQQLSALNAGLQEASSIPLFLTVDEEGGTVARLARCPGFDLPRFTSAAAVGAQGTAAALEMGRTIGSYLKQYGFNMDFAPVADVNTNPRNPVIGTRAFSQDPAQAAILSRAMAEGLADNGIIPVFKHFPGHGDTATDSHIGLALSFKTAEELWECEFLPYIDLDDQSCVMVGHIALPNVTGDQIPATLNPLITQQLLRDQLGFEGLVITDSMEMGAIRQQFSCAEAAVLALQAGCDVILMPYDLPEAFEAVLEAVEQGVITPQQLDERVLHILRFKESHGIL